MTARLKTIFNLSEVEQNLLSDLCNAFHALDKKVIVVLNVGGVVETASWKKSSRCYSVGMAAPVEGGNSVVDVLLGKENPSRKAGHDFSLSLSWIILLHVTFHSMDIKDKEVVPDVKI